jgi:hypothetical protein
LKNLKVGRLGLIFTIMLVLTGLTGACGELDEFNSVSNSADAPLATARPRPTIEGPSKTPTAVATGELSLTEQYPEKTVLRNFTDSQNRKVRLTYGRGTGHGGDYGWAHIYGKHFKGIWYDGGTISTFPLDAGAKTPLEVVNLIQKSLTDLKPDKEANDRLSYSYAIPGRNKDVFTVVGNDGTIITSYPVNHGSQNADS